MKNQRLGQYTRDASQYSKTSPGPNVSAALGQFPQVVRRAARRRSVALQPPTGEPPWSANAGFTLWELLCTLAIAGVTLGPAFRASIVSARRAPHGRRQRLGARRAARAQRGRQARPAGHASARPRIGTRCTAPRSSGTARAGWYSSNEDDVRPPQRSPASPCSTCMRRSSPARSSAIATLFEFRPFRPAQHQRHDRVLRRAAARRRRGPSS